MKQWFTVMLAVLMIFNSEAQNFNIGLNILRFNSTTVRPDVPFTTSAGSRYDFRMDHTAGFKGGFYLEKTLNPTLALQAELLWRFTTIAIISKDGHGGNGMDERLGGRADPF